MEHTPPRQFERAASSSNFAELYPNTAKVLEQFSRASPVTDSRKPFGSSALHSNRSSPLFTDLGVVDSASHRAISSTAPPNSDGHRPATRRHRDFDDEQSATNDTGKDRFLTNLHGRISLAVPARWASAGNLQSPDCTNGELRNDVGESTPAERACIDEISPVWSDPLGKSSSPERSRHLGDISESPLTASWDGSPVTPCGSFLLRQASMNLTPSSQAPRSLGQRLRHSSAQQNFRQATDNFPELQAFTESRPKSARFHDSSTGNLSSDDGACRRRVSLLTARSGSAGPPASVEQKLIPSRAVDLSMGSGSESFDKSMSVESSVDDGSRREMRLQHWVLGNQSSMLSEESDVVHELEPCQANTSGHNLRIQCKASDGHEMPQTGLKSLRRLVAQSLDARSSDVAEPHNRADLQSACELHPSMGLANMYESAQQSSTRGAEVATIRVNDEPHTDDRKASSSALAMSRRDGSWSGIVLPPPVPSNIERGVPSQVLPPPVPRNVEKLLRLSPRNSALQSNLDHSADKENFQVVASPQTPEQTRHNGCKASPEFGEDVSIGVKTRLAAAEQGPDLTGTPGFGWNRGQKSLGATPSFGLVDASTDTIALSQSMDKQITRKLALSPTEEEEDLHASIHRGEESSYDSLGQKCAVIVSDDTLSPEARMPSQYSSPEFQEQADNESDCTLSPDRVPRDKDPSLDMRKADYGMLRNTFENLKDSLGSLGFSDYMSPPPSSPIAVNDNFVVKSQAFLSQGGGVATADVLRKNIYSNGIHGVPAEQKEHLQRLQHDAHLPVANDLHLGVDHHRKFPSIEAMLQSDVDHDKMLPQDLKQFQARERDNVTQSSAGFVRRFADPRDFSHVSEGTFPFEARGRENTDTLLNPPNLQAHGNSNGQGAPHSSESRPSSHGSPSLLDARQTLAAASSHETNESRPCFGTIRTANVGNQSLARSSPLQIGDQSFTDRVGSSNFLRAPGFSGVDDPCPTDDLAPGLQRPTAFSSNWQQLEGGGNITTGSQAIENFIGGQTHGQTHVPRLGANQPDAIRSSDGIIGDHNGIAARPSANQLDSSIAKGSSGLQGGGGDIIGDRSGVVVGVRSRGDLEILENRRQSHEPTPLAYLPDSLMAHGSSAWQGGGGVIGDRTTELQAEGSYEDLQQNGRIHVARPFAYNPASMFANGNTSLQGGGVIIGDRSGVTTGVQVGWEDEKPDRQTPARRPLLYHPDSIVANGSSSLQDNFDGTMSFGSPQSYVVPSVTGDAREVSNGIALGSPITEEQLRHALLFGPSSREGLRPAKSACRTDGVLQHESIAETEIRSQGDNLPQDIVLRAVRSAGEFVFRPMRGGEAELGNQSSMVGNQEYLHAGSVGGQFDGAPMAMVPNLGRPVGMERVGEGSHPGTLQQISTSSSFALSAPPQVITSSVGEGSRTLPNVMHHAYDLDDPMPVAMSSAQGSIPCSAARAVPVQSLGGTTSTNVVAGAIPTAFALPMDASIAVAIAKVTTSPPKKEEPEGDEEAKKKKEKKDEKTEEGKTGKGKDKGGKGKGKGKAPPAPAPPKDGGKGKDGKDANKGKPVIDLKPPKTKPLGWRKIESCDENSFWALNTKTDDFEIEVDKLEEVFSWAPANGSRPTIDATDTKKEPEKISFTTRERSMGIAIGLRCMKHLGYDGIREAILALCTERLTAEATERLLSCDAKSRVPTVLPCAEEIAAARAHRSLGQGNDVLDDASRFILAVHDVPHLRDRLQLHQFRLEFAQSKTDISDQIQLLKRALLQVRESKSFASILALVLKTGNLLNDGTERGNASGFRIDSLPALCLLKGQANTAAAMAGQAVASAPTLLDFLVDIIAKQRPEIFGVGQELVDVPQASRIELEEVERTVKMCRADLLKIAKSLGMTNVMDLAALAPVEEPRERSDSVKTVDTQYTQYTSTTSAGRLSTVSMFSTISTCLPDGTEDSGLAYAPEFLEDSMIALSELDEEAGALRQQYIDIAAYFGEDRSTKAKDNRLPLHEWLGFISKFLTDLGKAQKAHRTRVERAERLQKQQHHRKPARKKTIVNNTLRRRSSGSLTLGAHFHHQHHHHLPHKRLALGAKRRQTKMAGSQASSPASSLRSPRLRGTHAANDGQHATDESDVDCLSGAPEAKIGKADGKDGLCIWRHTRLLIANRRRDHDCNTYVRLARQRQRLLRKHGRTIATIAPLPFLESLGSSCSSEVDDDEDASTSDASRAFEPQSSLQKIWAARASGIQLPLGGRSKADSSPGPARRESRSPTPRPLHRRSQTTELADTERSRTPGCSPQRTPERSPQPARADHLAALRSLSRERLERPRKLLDVPRRTNSSFSTSPKRRPSRNKTTPVGKMRTDSEGGSKKSSVDSGDPRSLAAPAFGGRADTSTAAASEADSKQKDKKVIVVTEDVQDVRPESGDDGFGPRPALVESASELDPDELKRKRARRLTWSVPDDVDASNAVDITEEDA